MRNSWKRSLSMLLAFVMILGMWPMNMPDVIAVGYPAGGNGTKDDPYIFEMTDGKYSEKDLQSNFTDTGWGTDAIFRYRVADSSDPWNAIDFSDSASRDWNDGDVYEVQSYQNISTSWITNYQWVTVGYFQVNVGGYDAVITVATSTIDIPYNFYYGNANNLSDTDFAALKTVIIHQVVTGLTVNGTTTTVDPSDFDVHIQHQSMGALTYGELAKGTFSTATEFADGGNLSNESIKVIYTPTGAQSEPVTIRLVDTRQALSISNAVINVTADTQAQFIASVQAAVIARLNISGLTAEDISAEIKDGAFYTGQGSYTLLVKVIHGGKTWISHDDAGVAAVEVPVTAGVNSYKVTWVVGGNSTEETYAYGATPSFKGQLTKEADAAGHYTFAGWEPEIFPVTGMITYTAVFTLAAHNDSSNDDDHKCDDCGYDGASGHTGGIPAAENNLDANCETAGSYDCVVYCTECGHEMSRTTIAVDAKGHAPAEAVKENNVDPSCGTAGSYDSVVDCCVCGKELSRETVVIQATGMHIYNEEVNRVAAGCTEDGYVIHKCACGATQTTTLAAPGHIAKDAVRENVMAATCYAEGSYDSIVYCDVCGYKISSEKKSIDKIDHTPAAPVTENAVAASCTESGAYDLVVYCSVAECHHEISRQTKTDDASGHGKQGYTYDAKENGTHDVVCKGCGVTTETVAHTFDTEHRCVCTAVETFAITFQDWDGTQLWSGIMEYGTVPTAPAVTAPANHTFAGWNSTVATVIGEATYTATYTLNANDGTVYVNATDKLNGLKNKVLTAAGLPANGSYTVSMITGNGSYNVESDNRLEILDMDTCFQVGDNQSFIITDNTTAVSKSVTMAVKDSRKPAVIGNMTQKVFGHFDTQLAFETAVKNAIAATWTDFEGNCGCVDSSDIHIAFSQPVTTVVGGKTVKTYTVTVNVVAGSNWLGSTEAVSFTGVCWTVNQYQITWLGGDGQEIYSEMVDYGAVPRYNAEQYGNPTKTGSGGTQYTWNTKWTTEVMAVTGPAVYTADFTADTVYIVTFNNNGALTYGYVNATKGESMLASVADPVDIKGYLFGGWFLDGVRFNKDTAVNGDITVTAKWIEDKNDNNQPDENETVHVDVADGGSMIFNGTAVNQGEYIFDVHNNSYTIVIMPPAGHYIVSVEGIHLNAYGNSVSYNNGAMTVIGVSLTDGAQIKVTFAKRRISAVAKPEIRVNGGTLDAKIAAVTKKTVLEAILGKTLTDAEVAQFEVKLMLNAAGYNGYYDIWELMESVIGNTDDISKATLSALKRAFDTAINVGGSGSFQITWKAHGPYPAVTEIFDVKLIEDTLTVHLLGDVDSDGDVDLDDALLMQAYVAHVKKETDLDLSVGDVDGNGAYDLDDALLIQMYAAKVITVFPAEEVEDES